MGTDGRTANGSHGNSWSDLASTSWRKREPPHFENEGWAHAHAEALLWDCRKEGKSWRALQYSIPTSRIKCPLDEVRRVKDELSEPPIVDCNAMDGDHKLLGAGTNLREKLGLMMAARKGNLYPDLWVRLCVDGTQLQKRHLEHFMLGVLGSGNPLGSWCILHGCEKRAVLRSLTRVSKMDEQVQEALNTRYEVQGGHMEKPNIFLVADVHRGTTGNGGHQKMELHHRRPTVLGVWKMQGTLRSRLWEGTFTHSVTLDLVRASAT